MFIRLSDRIVKQNSDYRASLAGILLLAAVAPLAAAPPSEGNVVPNGAFDEGSKHWSLHTEQGAKATFKVESVDGNPAGHVVVTNATGRNSHVQFACAFPQAPLQPGEIYRVEFRCKSSLPRNTRVVLIERGKPWGNAGVGREFPMTQQWQTQHACFRAKAVPCPDLKLDFFLGDASGDVWIDDVSIVHVDIDKLTAQRASAGNIQIAAQTTTFYLNDRGGLTGLRDSRTAHDLIFPLDEHPAFGLRLRRGQDIHETNADVATSITHERKGECVTFTATFPDMTVRYTYEPYGREGLLACRIRVDNSSQWAVTEVDFPRVFCPGRLGESSADDRLLYPMHDGGIVVDPYEKMMGKSLGSTYPGSLSCQVMAFYDPAGGVVVASLDPTGEVKRLCARGDLNLSLSVTQLRPVTPGADVVVDQPVVVGAFKGTWHDGAEVYRRWAQQQSFCATPLHKNPLWPAKFRNGAMVNYFSPGRMDKEKKHKYCLENLNSILPELKARSGLPMITISWGWEQHGMWCSQEYFPAFPSDEDFTARGALFDRFGTGMVMLSGYRWTFEKPWAPRGPYDGTERFNREVKPWVTCREDPATPTIVEPTGKQSYQGSKYATLCRATQFTNDTISEISQRCVKAGYTVIHWDQLHQRWREPSVLPLAEPRPSAGIRSLDPHVARRIVRTAAQGLRRAKPGLRTVDGGAGRVVPSLPSAHSKPAVRYQFRLPGQSALDGGRAAVHVSLSRVSRRLGVALARDQHRRPSRADDRQGLRGRLHAGYVAFDPLSPKYPLGAVLPGDVLQMLPGLSRRGPAFLALWPDDEAAAHRRAHAHDPGHFQKQGEVRLGRSGVLPQCLASTGRTPRSGLLQPRGNRAHRPPARRPHRDRRSTRWYAVRVEGLTWIIQVGRNKVAQPIAGTAQTQTRQHDTTCMA